MKKTYLLNKIFLCLSFSGMMYAQEVTINKNLKIERDGTLVYTDSATVFDDHVVDLSRAKSKTNSTIAFDEVENTVVFSKTSTLTDYIYVNVQMSHQWKSGTAIYPHIHFQQLENKVPNFLIQYRWQKNNATKTTAWTDLKCNTPAFGINPVYDFGLGALNQIVFSDAILPVVSEYGISDILQFRIIRDSGNNSTKFIGSDPYSLEVHVTSFDFHYEKDTDGSRNQYTK